MLRDYFRDRVDPEGELSRAKATAPIAQYYPHTRLHTESLLKAALLLWDYVDCIVPSATFAPEETGKSKLILEAEELLVRSRVPSPTEKQNVHAKIRAMLHDGVPSWLRQDLKGGDTRHYLMYPEKLGYETWRLLEEAELATAIDGGGRNYKVPSSLGLLMMSLLADECAGTTRIKVTDRNQSYSWLLGLMTDNCGGEYLGVEGTHLGRDLDRLVTAAIHTVDTGGIPLSKLLSFRQREQKEKSQDYASFRRNYLQRIQTYIEQLNVPKLSASDVGEVYRQYRNDMSADLRDLKRELKLADGAALTSTAMGTAVLAVAGSPIAPLAGALGVGALIHTGQKYRQARRTAFKSHAMSWLYLAN